MWMTRRDRWPRRRAFGMVDRLGSATAGRRVVEWEEMSMSNESILVILLVGLIAGWLAGQIVKGTGYGLVADICIGIIGALIGSWLLPQLGIHLGAGIVSSIIVATIGAIILLVILRLVNRGGRW
jgi:uncharacterized membrane protein YeaQ/YmgE (transglycosylase-associated protein family)